MVLNQVSGEFIKNEPISVNGRTDNPFTITDIDSYKINDVKSVTQASTSVDPNLQSDFSADNLLYSRVPTGFGPSDTVTVSTAGTVTCPGRFFDGYKVGDTIAYQKEGATALTLNEVTAVADDELSLTVGAVADVTGVADGTLPSVDTRSNIRIFDSKLLNQDNSFLYVTMEESNIASVNLAASNLTFTKQINNLSTDGDGTLTINSSALDVTGAQFAAFDQERYSVHYSDGSIATISASQVTVTGSEVTFTNLTPSQTTNVTVNVTAVKDSIKSKTKVVLRSEQLIVNKISSGIGTAVQGLAQNPYYGLRVDDEEISLNQPDVKEIVAVL